MTVRELTGRLKDPAKQVAVNLLDEHGYSKGIFRPEHIMPELLDSEVISYRIVTPTRHGTELRIYTRKAES